MGVRTTDIDKAAAWYQSPEADDYRVSTASGTSCRAYFHTKDIGGQTGTELNAVAGAYLVAYRHWLRSMTAERQADYLSALAGRPSLTERDRLMTAEIEKEMAEAKANIIDATTMKDALKWWGNGLGVKSVTRDDDTGLWHATVHGRKHSTWITKELAILEAYDRRNDGPYEKPDTEQETIDEAFNGIKESLGGYIPSENEHTMENYAQALKDIAMAVGYPVGPDYLLDGLIEHIKAYFWWYEHSEEYGYSIRASEHCYHVYKAGYNTGITAGSTPHGIIAAYNYYLRKCETGPEFPDTNKNDGPLRPCDLSPEMRKAIVHVIRKELREEFAQMFRKFAVQLEKLPEYGEKE